MINLLTETISFLAEYRKTPDDVQCIEHGGKGCCNWEDFAEIAKDINYDNGYGAVEIDLDLIIFGDNWWAERHEYDGSECWQMRTRPSMATEYIKPTKRDIYDYWYYQRKFY